MVVNFADHLILDSKNNFLITGELLHKNQHVNKLDKWQREMV